MIKRMLTLLLITTVFQMIVFPQQINNEEIQTLNGLLDRWHRDAASANLDAYLGAMTPDAVFIGTDATEYWTAGEFRDFCKPYFERKQTWNFHPVERHMYLSEKGNTAWFDELLDTQMGLCRGSGALVLTAGGWKIAHYVLSATIPNDLIKAVTRMKGATDTALILKGIFDQYNLDGTIILLDPGKGTYFGYNPARWDSGYLPASTFKIPNSLIGLETGVIDTTFIFRWRGEKRRLPQWEKDMNLQEAFRLSCVPCYQELADKIGFQRMQNYLQKLDYGNMVVTDTTLNLFWLEGPSRITPRQQVEFLQRLRDGKLPLDYQTIQIMKHLMINEQTTSYTLNGKTGWAIRNGNNYGWFVGWIEAGGKVVYFATLVEPINQANTSDFNAARKSVTLEVLRFFLKGIH